MDTQDNRKNDQHLLAFLKAYKDWVYAGAPDDQPFARRCGLCLNHWYYLQRVVQLDPGFQNDRDDAVQERLGHWLGQDGLDREIPFNMDGPTYSEERLNNTQHLNLKRQAWVEKTIKRLESHE